MKTPFALFLSLSALLSASAQEPTDFRTEQVFLAPRSLSCAPGDSLFVDGMVTCMASDRLEPYSRYLYLELIGDNDSVYVRQKLSCADGGRFRLAVDDFAEGDTFFLQALQGKKNEPVSNGIALDNESFPAAVIDRGRLITSGRYAGDVTTSIGQSSGTVHDLPDVTVKARVIQKSEVPSKSHYEVKMKTREAIERRGYLTLRDILNDMPMLTLTSESFDNGTDNGLQLPVIYSKRGISLLGRRKIGENVGMALVIDGSKIDNDNFDLYLEMSATEIESVEQVSIGEALIYAKTLDGAVIVKTRKWTPDKSVKSKGTIVRPMGLSNIPLASNEKPVVPSKDGDYRLLVDIVGPDGVTSLSRPFTLSTAK